jgi:hypothetical protein
MNKPLILYEFHMSDNKASSDTHLHEVSFHSVLLLFQTRTSKNSRAMQIHDKKKITNCLKKILFQVQLP